MLIPFNSNRKQHRDGYGMRLERQRYDGWYNNMAHPEWGAVGKLNQLSSGKFMQGEYRKIY